MKVKTNIAFFLLLYGAAYTAAVKEPTETLLIYRGASDASAAVAVDKDMFIVADDENNILRVYSTNKPGLPILSYDLSNFLDIETEHPEADIEGATIIRDRIYWITSHGRNKDGQLRPNRYRFFATTVKIEDGNIVIHPIGVPCKNLVHNMLEAKTTRHLGLDKVTRFGATNLSKKQLEYLAPKKQGLNIEGLCASADGRTLYIGFRNPQIWAWPFREYDKKNRGTKALVVQLKNPDAVIERSAIPTFDEPMLWDLHGLGIRSMEYSPFHQEYFIVAGHHDESSNSALYRWSGKNNERPILMRDLSSEKIDFTPEALVVFKNSDKLLLLSDDGSLRIKVNEASECMQGQLNDDGTCPNKFLTDSNQKTFRAIWLKP